MRHFFQASAALLLSASLGLGQATPKPTPLAHPAPRATPRPTPHPRPPFALDNSLMDTGAFEGPRVTKRTPMDQGGNPLPYSQGEWIRFAPNAAAKDGTLIAGLTNEAARTGRQSLYVEFRHQTKQGAVIELASRLIQVKPESVYHVAIWGRNDAKNPITIDERLPFLRVEVDFFKADEETQTGESILKMQSIPGTLNRPPLFPTDQWGEFYVDAKAPEDAAFIKVTWAWMAPADPGETNGVVYFDDATIIGDKPAPPPEPTEPAPPTPGAEAPAPAATPTPATPAPAKRSNG